MTADRRAKREARDRAAATGEPYTRARRATTNPTVADVPPAEGVSEPVAVQLARHLHAASYHLGAWRGLAERHANLPGRPLLGDKPAGGPTAPITRADQAISEALWGLRGWTERTAQAAGAISTLPEPMTTRGPGAAAYEALYPTVPDIPGWCATPGGRMPQPGEAGPAGDVGGHDAPTSPIGQPGDTVVGSAAERRRVRQLLRGPVPDWHLAAHATGQTVRRASDIVPGTPAASIWDAGRTLETYTGGWMDRAGDAPGDLAAAVDGLTELADGLATAVRSVIQEVARRVEAGVLTGVDTARLATVLEQLTALMGAPADDSSSAHDQLRGMLWAARAAITGARATLPPWLGERVNGLPAGLDKLAGAFDGRSAAALRDELGREVHYQRLRSKTRPTQPARGRLLERMLAWLHAVGADQYNAAEHLAAERALP